MKTLEERFWAKVHKTDGCWEWTAFVNSDGYGRIIRGRVVLLAHRVSWEFANGPIPGGLLVCHHCDNRPCIRPEHLFLGTYSDNAIDMTKKGRHGAHVHPESVRRGDGHWSRVHPEKVSRGSGNGASKLTEEKVQNMRKVRLETGMPYHSLGALFGVSANTAHEAVSGKRWGHVS